PNFLRPNKGSELATEGAGKVDPSLPSYIGAVPPEGVAAWDWSRTWLAWPPGKLLTVSKKVTDGGAYRTINAALAVAKPVSTVRLQDDAVYAEHIVLDDPKKHQGIALEAPQGATIQMSPQAPQVLAIKEVPYVRLSGFRFRAPKVVLEPSPFVVVS